MKLYENRVINDLAYEWVASRVDARLDWIQDFSIE